MAWPGSLATVSLLPQQLGETTLILCSGKQVNDSLAHRTATCAAVVFHVTGEYDEWLGEAIGVRPERDSHGDEITAAGSLKVARRGTTGISQPSLAMRLRLRLGEDRAAVVVRRLVIARTGVTFAEAGCFSGAAKNVLVGTNFSARSPGATFGGMHGVAASLTEEESVTSWSLGIDCISEYVLHGVSSFIHLYCAGSDCGCADCGSYRISF